jgi:hypothetical protein
METVARVLIQLVVAGPVLFYALFALAMGIRTIVGLFTGESYDVSHTIVFGLGWVGLLGLYGSIFTPLETIRARRWLRAILTVCMVCGFIVVATMTFGFFPHWDLVSIDLIVGPVVVGCWNLIRIYRPNQSVGKA